MIEVDARLDLAELARAGGVDEAALEGALGGAAPALLARVGDRLSEALAHLACNPEVIDLACIAAEEADALGVCLPGGRGW